MPSRTRGQWQQRPPCHGGTAPWLQALHICAITGGLQAAAFAVSMSSVYLPKRALLLHQARWWNACCASATFAESPFQALSTGACKARPKEKLNCHGRSLRRFIALRCSVACRSVCPPERKTRPGTAAGTTRFMQRNVAAATSCTEACLGQSFPERTI